MNFSSINIQGNIVSSDILTKISQDDVRFQKPSDFGLNNNIAVRDEIGIAWSLAQAHWKAFVAKKEHLRDDDAGTTITRQSWIVPLMQSLGYELQIAKAEIINEKSYAISHRAINKDGFPVHVVGFKQSLDKRADYGARLSPHALVQEYLNNNEHLYAFTTNGYFFRVLRDAIRLSKLSYLEFNLQRMMEEELYAEFAVLFRLLHATRMPDKADEGANSIFEFYHQEALASGTRIRERLSKAVEKSIRLLGNGLLQHPANASLREAANQELKANKYYLYLLRVVYRILFLLVIEERNLIYPEKQGEEIQKKRRFYYNFYSLQRLTKLVERRVYVDPRKTDLWDALLTTFKLFEQETYGAKLGIQALGSGLFAPDAIGLLDRLKLDNETILQVLRHLVLFENENRQYTRVNYADLDVEEFGSVYEGLLEYEPVITLEHELASFSFKPGSGRGDTGAHYTPEELVKPLIKHSLDYIIEDKLKEGKAKGGDQWLQMQTQCDNLLTITVCDVACGSGHILLSAARRIGMELAILRESMDAKHIVEQPSPTFLRQAIRDVIRHCIYGVDLNPLAVELCKVALWLEAHNPGEPLNFLDHHIKNGNAIVGLAFRDELENGISNEAFKTLPGDDKDVAKTFRDKNTRERKERDDKNKVLQLTTQVKQSTTNMVQEAMAEYKAFRQLPEATPDHIAHKAKAYTRFIEGKGYLFLKTMADVQVSQFFIPKTTENKERLLCDNEFRQILTGQQVYTGPKTAYATAVAQYKHFFHWFLEFPEVFNNGGFDCILGNPPFLGGQKLTGTYGHPFAEYVKQQYAPIGSVDLVTYFFRRIYDIMQTQGFLSLISTNTIAQGDARAGGLAVIAGQGGTINHAVRSMKWPGRAAVEVALVTIHKGPWKGKCVLDQKVVPQITSYLDDSILLGDPYPLKANENKSFQGSIVLGKGFVMTPEEAQKLIAKDPKNQEVLFPYLNGDDLNNQIDQSSTRWVINFKDWPLRRFTQEEWQDLSADQQKEINQKVKDGRTIEIAPPDYTGPVAADYPDCLEIVERDVKPERQRWKIDSQGNEIIGEYALRKPLPERWWHYGEKRPALYSTIAGMERVMVVAQVSKTVCFTFITTKQVISMMCIALITEQYSILSLLQSTIHKEWVQKYASALKSDIRYTPSDVFENFPLPLSKEESLDKIGVEYDKCRIQLMQQSVQGLTKTYNAFHAKDIQPILTTAQLTKLTPKEIEKQYSKEVWNLWNHLQKIPIESGQASGTCTWEEAVASIVELRRLHKQMDEAVLEAYGWHQDDAHWGKAINLAHDFYEVDYLPENDRVRYTISPAARKEVLKRLLLLNHERYEQEIQQGLHKQADVEAFYAQKGVPVPADTTFSDKKGAAYKVPAKSRKVEEDKGEYGMGRLF